jgi:ElaB/YqjD/DUF883 family membrane-anchored ribosome-binding protein
VQRETEQQHFKELGSVFESILEQNVKDTTALTDEIASKVTEVISQLNNKTEKLTDSVNEVNGKVHKSSDIGTYLHLRPFPQRPAI